MAILFFFLLTTAILFLKHLESSKVPISYELKNGDVVSILTGEGKPSTDWMRYAKSRSTRSKLRAYFRSKQNDSFRRSGEILIFDYLKHRRDEILESSYIANSFQVPETTEELSTFLPGRSRYHDVDELLIDIGKNHDADFLRQKISKIFLVPLSVLVAYDKSHFTNITRSVYAAQKNHNVPLVDGNEAQVELNLSFLDVLNEGAIEFADVENLCQHCLPIRGDTILGTKRESDHGPIVVHRYECPYAQEVLHSAHSKRNCDAEDKVQNKQVPDNRGSKANDRSRTRSRFSSLKSLRPTRNEEPVQLRWPELEESWEEGKSETFLAEVVVVANDRKLLLADCSVIVSKNSEILKTGSSSSSEHCILEFLTRVRDLDELQSLMDKLSEVDCVMSVERRVSLVNIRSLLTAHNSSSATNKSLHFVALVW